MIEAANKLLARAEHRLEQLENIDERNEKQDAMYAACEELVSALQNFIDEYEGA